MTSDSALERSYRRWLRLYPASFRREHEAEMLAVLLRDTGEDKRRPDIRDCVDLLCSAAVLWLRPRIPRSDRTAAAATRLMYLGALVETATVATILVTLSTVRSTLSRHNAGYDNAQWHAELSGHLIPLVVAGCFAIAVWLLLAWANGRRHRWARVAFLLFFAMNAYGLIHGLQQGSAHDAQADLAAGATLCLVQFAALALLYTKPFLARDGTS